MLGAAAAGTCAAGALDGSVQLTSDFVFRGRSQTAGDPAVQGGVQYRTATNTVLGTWASTVGRDPEAGRGVELDLYLAQAWRVRPWLEASATAVRYTFPRDPGSRNYDYTELIGSLTVDDRATLTVAWSPDTATYVAWNGVKRAQTYSTELALRQPVSAHSSLFGSAGYQDVHALYGEAYWSFSAGLAWESGSWSASVGHFATSNSARRMFGDDVAGPRWAGTVGWRFR